MSKQHLVYGKSVGVESTGISTLPFGAELRKIYIDTTNPIDTVFAEYGHVFYQPLVQNGRGQWVRAPIKYWEKDGDYCSILPLNTPVYPFEPMEEDLKKVIETELKGMNWKIVSQDFTHRGFSSYWTLLSPDIRETIKGSYVQDDVVQVGLVVRNGINTGVSLGADFYTYRLSCSNGAIGRGENFGSISIRHVGDRNKIVQTFKEGIPLVVKAGQKILEYYQMATAIRFDPEMAKKIFKKTPIAQKYFPTYFGVDEDEKDPDKKVNLTAQGKSLTLWEVFNDLTGNLTASYKGIDPKGHLGFSGFNLGTRELHKCLVQIVDKHGSV